MSTQETGGRGTKRKNANEGEEGSRVGGSPPRKYSLRSATSTPAKAPLVVEGEDLALWTIFERERKRKMRLEEAKKREAVVSPAKKVGKAIKFPPRLLNVSEIPDKGKVTTYSKADHLLAIKGALRGTDFYKALLNSPLGTVFEIPVKKAAMSGRLVHSMLCRMLLTRKRHELWFVVANKPIRFSLKEFAALTGLPCGPFPPHAEMEKLRRISNSPDAYWNELMVGRLANGYVQDIVDLLWAKNELAEERAAMPVTTKVRLCLVVLIDGVICARGPASVKATRLTVEMVKDVKKFLTFPWGREAFELTLEVCRVGSESNATVDDLLKRLVVQKSICLKGFPVALQMLFYEAVPAFNDMIFSDPREIPVDFANTDLEKIDLNRTFTTKDILGIDESPETQVTSLVEYGYVMDGVDLTWKDELADPLVDNVLMKIADSDFVFTKHNWKKGLIENPAAVGGLVPPKKERAGARKTAKPTRRSTRGRTKPAETKQQEMDISKFFVHRPTDLINDFFYSVVYPVWIEKKKRDEKLKAEQVKSDEQFYADVMNALVANAKAQNIFKKTVELSDSSAGSAEGEASSASVEVVAHAKDDKGKGKVGEVELLDEVSEDENQMRQFGTGPSGMRQPEFDETPVTTKNMERGRGGFGLSELMQLDPEKDARRDLGMGDIDLGALIDKECEKAAEGVVEVTGKEPAATELDTEKDARRDEVMGEIDLGELVDKVCANPAENVLDVAGEDPAATALAEVGNVGRKEIVCALATPEKPKEQEVKPVEDEQLQLRDEEVDPPASVTAINHEELGFAAVEERKLNAFFKATDAFVPAVYIVNDLEVPKTTFREIATKGTHVSTDQMELMLALVWKRLRNTLAEKRSVILDTYFVQHLLKDARKLKKRAKAFKWHKSLVAIVNGRYASREGNTKWMVDVDVVYAPMNWSDNHWVTLCIDLAGGIVTVFDCFVDLHSEDEAVDIMAPVLETLPALIAEFADDLPGEYDAPNAFVFKRPRNVSQNIPTGDCGPMSVKFIELHAQGMPVDCMTEKMVDNLRENYAIDIYETFYTPLSWIA